MPKAHNIPVIDCVAGERKHDVANDYPAKTAVTEGLFLVLVGRAPAPVWHVGANYHLERKKPYVNHYSFHTVTGGMSPSRLAGIHRSLPK